VIVKETNLTGFKLVGRGKVRDIYQADGRLLIVATDRISAFDVVMDDPIPDKGRVLTAISRFWFEQVEKVVPHHIISYEPADVPGLSGQEAEALAGRMMLVHQAKPLAVECIVRGYLAGSGWADYQRSGAVCGHNLPAGLKESARLDEPLFTPSTKADLGAHDENISFEQAMETLGQETAERVRDLSLAIYGLARDLAAARGIIIADTKFEFGLVDGELILIDEVLTPDSSRFWPADKYQPGRSQPSFDKQFLRDYLAGLDWDKAPPPPKLPPQIIDQTRAKYLEALKRLTGQGLEGPA